MLTSKKFLTSTLALGLLFSVNSYAWLSNPIEEQISFVNLTPDTITITNTSHSECAINISGLFKGNSIILSKIEFNSTDNTGILNRATERLINEPGEYCIDSSHEETLMLTSSLQISKKPYQLSFNIYLPVAYADKKFTYGGLSFDSNDNDQGDNLTTLSLSDSKQLAKVDLTKYPYLLQIQGSHLGNDGSLTQQPIIYIYPNPQYQPY